MNSPAPSPAPSPVAIPAEIAISPGPVLLEGLSQGSGLAAHRARWGGLRRLGVGDLVGDATALGLAGRGGAGFPFARKLTAAAQARGRAEIVVNVSEGEPVSAKDTALALTRPQLILDGAVAAATALGARVVHVVVTGERPAAEASLSAAVAERDDSVQWRFHRASPRFVAGQARAVIELIEGRPNLPVTAWQPEAIAGIRGRPTLLSNAETWAHVGVLATRGLSAYDALGTPAEPGTTLLTLVDDTGIAAPVTQVLEVPFGTRWRSLLTADQASRAAVIGGFHGSWVTAQTLASARVSPAAMRLLGAPLGAGAVWLQPPRACPLAVTQRTVAYLADQSARRCGPCFNGLPALADALALAVRGHAGEPEITRLNRLVRGRGACAHPDGTVRLIRSLLMTFPGELRGHAEGRCPAAASTMAVA